MKSFLHLFLSLAFAGMLFSGCPGPGPDPEERPFVSLPDEFKSYCYFKEGSYWIYQNDSLASFQDSAYVLSSSCVDQYDVDRVEFDFQNCFYNLVYLGQPWTMDLYPIPETDVEGPYLYVLREYRPSTFDQEAYHLFLDESGLDYMRIGDEHTFIHAELDSLELNGTWYRDIVHVRHDAQTFGNPVKEVFWARNIGIVKRVLWNDQSWSLLRHNQADG